MHIWQVVFGDNIAKAVTYIQKEALLQGTVSAYDEGIAKLRGIDYLLICMGFHADLSIRMSNEIMKLARLRDNLVT